MVNYPAQIKAVGPMVRTWTIHHEAKLNFFKQAAHLANFKNIAFSLAYRHQRWMCFQLASENLHMPLECGPARQSNGLSCVKDETKDIQDGLSNIILQLSFEVAVFRPTWVCRNGVLYQSNNAYLITSSDGLDPVFGHIDDITVVGGDMVIFALYLCKVSYFDFRYHAYVVTVTSHQSLFLNLLDHNVYHGHRLADGFTYITLKYHILS